MKKKSLFKYSLLFIPVLCTFSIFAQTTVHPGNIASSVAEISPSKPWFRADTRTGGSVSISDEQAKAGCGSLKMTSTSSFDVPNQPSQAKAQLFNYSYIGTTLNSINSLGYYAYRSSSSTTSPAQTISLNIQVDYLGDGNSFTTLVFEPVYQAGGVGAIQNNTWQLWDAYNGGNAVWWSTRAAGNPSTCASSSCYFTWNQFIDAFPNAKITATGGIGFNIGSGWAGNFQGYVDAFNINSIYYNFETSPDSDGDAFGDDCDNCPSTYNPFQENYDGDAMGDICDSDDDNDGVLDANDSCPRGELGWISTSSTDIDHDGCRDVTEDLDDDNDGVLDSVDNCPSVANPGQEDMNNNHIGDVCDDSDGDGVPDAYDCDPLKKKNNKWLVCHNGHTICIAQSAVAAHLNHGDALGACANGNRGGVTDITDISEDFKITAAPNPVISSAVISYELPIDAKVQIVLFDPLGKAVNTLVNGDKKAGTYNYTLDVTKLPAGIYYYRMTAVAGAEKFVQGQKLMIVK